MSDYPIVYGFCDAGCKRRVPRYDEVDAVLNKNYVSIGLSFEEREADDGSTYYSVVGRGTCPDKDIVIPSSYQGYPVRAIWKRAFFQDETITSVTIPRSVKTIWSDAFGDCPSLSAVYLEEGVETIDANAFRDCPSLTSIILPDSVQNIERYAFYGCTALKKVYLGMNLKEIGDHAFNSEGLEIFYHGTHEQWNAVNLDGEWASSFTFYVTYAHNMKGATSSAAGAGGYVPTPAAGNQAKALLGNGTWGDPETAKTAERMASLVAATDNASRPVWFSDSITPTIPRKDNDFSYNPSTNTLNVKNINTNSTVKRVFAPATLMLTYGEVLDIGELPDGKELDDLMLVTIGAPYKDGFLGVVGYGVREYSDDELAFRFSVDYAYAHLMFSAEIGHGDGSMWMTIGQDGAPVRGWSISSVDGAKLLEITEGDLVPQKVCITLYFK